METTTTAWEQVLGDPSLQDLPYKVETNALGQVVLSPRKLKQSFVMAQLARLFGRFVVGGEALIGAAIETGDGVKVVDVAWMSEARWRSMPEDAAAAPVAPEICVEVLSRTNTADEMAKKRWLYFERGAHEVWLCDDGGRMTFYLAGEPEPVAQSRLAPPFPKSIYEAS